MNKERIEYELDTDHLMNMLYVKAGREKSLRDLEALTGISASTFSRMNNGTAVDMEAFLKLCAFLDAPPGQFFNRVVWRVVETKGDS